MSRYLPSPERKAAIITEWSRSRSELGDPLIIPWCDRINALCGIVTMQSCQGHERDDARGTEYGTYIDSGHLWCWMTKEAAVMLYHHAPALSLRTDLIEKLAFRFIGEREHLDIVFRGHGTGDMNRSMPLILGWMQSSLFPEKVKS